MEQTERNEGRRRGKTLVISLAVVAVVALLVVLVASASGDGGVGSLY